VLRNEGPPIAYTVKAKGDEGPKVPTVNGLEALPVDLQPGQEMKFQVAAAIGDMQTFGWQPGRVQVSRPCQRAFVLGRSRASPVGPGAASPVPGSPVTPGVPPPTLRAAGLPDSIRFYDLRHTCASLLIREGASIKAVQKQMGHATAGMTLDVYGHLFPDELDSIAERLDQVRANALEARRVSECGPSVAPLLLRSPNQQVRGHKTRVPEEGLEPGSMLLRRPRSDRWMAGDLRFSLAGRDRSCPRRTSGSRCRADPARTRAMSYRELGKHYPTTYRQALTQLRAYGG
jgi:hypothetical protein